MDVNIGDLLQIGTAIQLLQPRSPCYKLQIRFERPDMTALFFQQAKPGWYASVLKEESFSAQGEIFVTALQKRSPSLTSGAIAPDVSDRATVKGVDDLKLLPDFWKNRASRHQS